MFGKKCVMIGFLALCLTATLFLTMATTSTTGSSEYDPCVAVPIGAIIPWAKNLTGVPPLPDNFVECNGQTLNDNESPLHGQIIPNLNGENRFLRGNSVSGTTGGSETHSHSIAVPGTAKVTWPPDIVKGHPGHTNSTSNLPPYYDVVWIMKVKYSAPTEPVGGLWIPADKFSLLAPYIALVSTIILAISASVAYIKYRKKQ